MTVYDQRILVKLDPADSNPFSGADFEASESLVLNANCVTQSIYICTRPLILTSAQYSHAVAGSDAGAVNIQLTKDVPGTAPGAGTTLLINNSNAGFNAKGTANTPISGALVASDASLTFAAGDRISIRFTGTLTALAGVTVTASLRRI